MQKSHGQVKDQAYSLSNILFPSPKVKKNILYLGEQISVSPDLEDLENLLQGLNPPFNAPTTLTLRSELAAHEPWEG